jgi:hypothetical protein
VVGVAVNKRFRNLFLEPDEGDALLLELISVKPTQALVGLGDGKQERVIVFLSDDPRIVPFIESFEHDEEHDVDTRWTMLGTPLPELLAVLEVENTTKKTSAKFSLPLPEAMPFIEQAAADGMVVIARSIDEYAVFEIATDIGIIRTGATVAALVPKPRTNR